MLTNRTTGEFEQDEVGVETKPSYGSFFGGVDWMVITRADLAVYVQALQRRERHPGQSIANVLTCFLDVWRGIV